MFIMFRGMVRAVAVVACLGVGLTAFGGAAVAQTAPAGPVVIRNESGSAITLTNVKYTDEYGAVQTVAGRFDLPAEFHGHLLEGKQKIRASKIEYDLVTTDGKTVQWSCAAKKLDADGDFVGTFTAQNLADHRKTLGVKDADPVKGKGPTDDDIGRGVLKVIGALVAHEATKKEPEDLADVFAIELARGLRDELVKSALDDLFPQIGKDARRLSSDLTIAALNGRLTDDKLTAAQAQKQAADYIRAKCPKFENPEELAAFVVGVERGVRSQK